MCIRVLKAYKRLEINLKFKIKISLNGEIMNFQKQTNYAVDTSRF